MRRDRVILWAFVVGLALLIVVQIVGSRMMHQRQQQYDPHSKPSPKAFDLFAP